MEQETNNIYVFHEEKTVPLVSKNRSLLYEAGNDYSVYVFKKSLFQPPTLINFFSLLLIIMDEFSLKLMRQPYSNFADFF